jgi:hypothetical protein
MKSWQRVLIACKVGLLAGGLLAGCGDDDPGSPDARVADAGPADGGPGAGPLQRTIPAADKLDILFVVDDTSGMAGAQQRLAANLPALFGRLQGQATLPDLHVGVISTSLLAHPDIPGCRIVDSDEGLLQFAFNAADPTCADGSLALDGSFLRDAPGAAGARATNYTGELTQVLSCMVQLGVDGCGFEQPLAAMRRALESPENAGFLRTDAVLAVVFLAGEDDCSAQDLDVFDPTVVGKESALGPLSSFRCFEFGVECSSNDPRMPGEKTECAPRQDSPYMYSVDELVDALSGIKPDPQQIAVAGILGVDLASPDAPIVVVERESGVGAITFALEPACQLTDEAGEVVVEGDPAVRLRAFLEGFPGRNQLATICDQDFSGTLDGVGALFARAVNQRWCLSADVDRAPGMPGVQHACQVREVRYESGSVVSETPLAACSSDTPPAGELPCWQLAAPSDRCQGNAPVELVIRRDQPPADGSLIEIRCDPA